MKLLTSLVVRGGGKSCIARTLSRSISIPFLLTINPSNFSDVAPKVHFAGLSFSWNFLNHSNSFLKFTTCSSSPWDFAIISSTYTSISLCIILWNSVTIALWYVVPAFFNPKDMTL